jgi:hypothetical protein
LPRLPREIVLSDAAERESDFAEGPPFESPHWAGTEDLVAAVGSRLPLTGARCPGQGYRQEQDPEDHETGLAVEGTGRHGGPPPGRVVADILSF